MPSPFYTNTPRYGLRSLLGTSSVLDIDEGILAALTDVENTFAGYKSGTHAARLAAANVDGLLWRETDTGAWFLGTGTAWVSLSGLSWTNVSAATAAVSGTFYNVTATATVTLPAATVNQQIGVRCGAASTVVTITTGAGSISGLGVAAASSSITLGFPGAFVVLQADGTNWNIVAGQRDTGWVSGQRIVGDVVRGVASVTIAGGSTNGQTTIATGLTGTIQWGTASLVRNGGGAFNLAYPITAYVDLTTPAVGLVTNGTVGVTATYPIAFSLGL